MNVAPEITPVLAAEFERLYVRPKSGRTLVVGSRVYPTREDRRKRYADAVGVDMAAGDGVDVVCDLTEPYYDWMELDVRQKFGHIDCISVLEHTKLPDAMAYSIQELLEPSGTLFVTVPFCWRVHSYPDDYWRFTPAAVRLLFPRINWVKLCLAHAHLSEDDKVPQIIEGGQVYFARTEVYGFGVLT